MFQGFKVLDPGLCVLGSWFLDPRSWVLHPGYWVSDYRSWSLGSRLLILNYATFNGTGNPISLFHGKIDSLSFRFDKLQSLISKFKNAFQLIGIQKPDLENNFNNSRLENYNIEYIPTESANIANVTVYTVYQKSNRL